MSHFFNSAARRPLASKPLQAALAVSLSCTLALAGAPAVALAEETAGQSNAAATQPADAQQAQTDGLLIFAEGTEGISTLSVGSDASACVDDALVADLEAAGIEQTGASLAADGTVMIAAQPANGQSVEEAVAAAQALDGVTAAQPSYVYEVIDAVQDPVATSVAQLLSESTATASIGVNDPFASISDPSISHNQYWLYNCDFNTAWQTTRTDGDVTIAVFDTGVMQSHQDLNANVLTQYAYDSYSKTLIAESDGLEFSSGHGTMVAGAASAVANNAFGMAGAAYNASLLPIKVSNDNTASPKITTASLLAAYDYLFSLVDAEGVNVRVVNMSLGSRGTGSSLNDTRLEAAIAKARSQYGIVTVCAGGNGKNFVAQTDPMYPADFDECVSVTALQPDGTNIAWSDYNQYKDISAPGGSITVPLASTDGDTTGFTWASGSSLASPIVAGAFALMFAAEPEATVDEAIAALYATAQPVEDSVNDRSQTSGSHGQIDVDDAIAYLKEHHESFTDVPYGTWYFTPIEYVHDLKLMNGHDGKMYPEDSLTRAEAAQILYNMCGKNATAPAAGQNDVVQSEWYAPAVNWCVATSTMIGHQDERNIFGVDELLTREQLALVMARVAEADFASASDSAFNALPDCGDTNSWARDAMIWATDKHVINGLDLPGGKMLYPGKQITRAEMAQVLMNSIENNVITL